ncbi:dipeptidase [Amycolatopsis jejuensis]|uniref:dipeptidase n=1 Tax=Amycolatopsis jejuensis TaxID=330084 RepID=UPI000527C195|nr:dipeptidase [Amycolatopsis jejuensis]
MPETSPVARSLHERSIVVDAHNDLLMTCVRQPVAEQGRYFREHWLPQLHAGGVGVQVLPVFIEAEFRPDGALRQTLRMLEAGWRIAEHCADEVRLCLTGAEIDDAIRLGKTALVLAMEGCAAVGTDVELFGLLHRLGVRIASFTHFGRTMLADGSAEDGAGGRLTASGVEAVAACEQLGIMLDVSHLGAASTDHLLELATRPLIASHSSAYAVRAHHRNLTDERLRAIAALGGVVGINVLANFIDECEHTVSRVADHIEHAAKVAGEDHVGLGPDFIREISDSLSRPGEYEWGLRASRPYIPGLEGPSGLPNITEELVRRGWTAHRIQPVLGLNFHRLFARELGVPGADRAG